MTSRVDRQRGEALLAALLTTVLLGASPVIAQESGEAPPPDRQEAEDRAEEQEGPPPPQEPVFDPVASQLAPGTPDELITANGTRLIGEFKELKSAQVKFKVTATGNIYVKWELVRTVRTSRFFEVLLTSGVRFYGLIVGTDDGRLFVGVGESFTEIARREVVEVTRIRQGFWDRQKGSLSVGLGVSKASSQSDLTVDLQTNNRTRTTEWLLQASSYQRRQEGADDVERNSAMLSYTRFLPKKWLVTSLATVERNNELSLELRTQLAAGAGYHPVRTMRHDLLVSAGLAPNREVYLDETPSATNIEAFVLARYTFYFLTATDTRIETQAAIFPSLSTGGRYRFVGNLKLLHEFTTDFSVNLTGYATYDTKPPTVSPTTTSDYNLSLGVGLTW